MQRQPWRGLLKAFHYSKSISERLNGNLRVLVSLDTSIKSNGHLLIDKNMFSQSYSQKSSEGLEKVAETYFLSCVLDFSSTL
jgi:hypothetical protein